MRVAEAATGSGLFYQFRPWANGGLVVSRTAKLADQIMKEHPLATEKGLRLFIGLLFHIGAMCPKCSYGTRVTSKRWAECKKCGERVPRRRMPK